MGAELATHGVSVSLDIHARFDIPLQPICRTINTDESCAEGAWHETHAFIMKVLELGLSYEFHSLLDDFVGPRGVTPRKNSTWCVLLNIIGLITTDN